MKKEMEDVLAEARTAIDHSADLDGLNAVRIQYLGKKESIQAMRAQMKNLPREEKPAFGQMVNELKNEGMAAYYWTIDTEDWNSRDANAVYDSVIGKVKDGDIILMHEIYDSTADALDRIIPQLLEEGYQLVTCSELVQAKSGNPPVPGTEYVSGTRTMN